MKLLPLLGSALVACALALSSPAFGADKPKDDAKKPTPINKKCPVEGGSVDPDISLQHKGKTIGFCCAGCDTEFTKDPAKYMAVVDKELAAEKKGEGKDEPKKGDDAKKDGEKQAELNAKCPVTDDDADKSLTADHKGRTIAFCCEGCVTDFKNEPEKYVAKLDKQKSSKKSDDHKDHDHDHKK